MKVELQSSMTSRIASAQESINAHFASVGAQSAAIDAIHTRKREIAADVKAGQAAPDAFQQEAELRGVTADDLADLILSKPCPIVAADERELQRQRILLAVEAAKTPADIEAALSALN
jgi:hypothetical protein